jgi:hypothetical protein
MGTTKLLLIISALVLAGCETTIKRTVTAPDGTVTESKLSETAFLAEMNVQMVTAMKDATNNCAESLKYAGSFTTEEGERGLARAVEECYEGQKLSAVAGRPITPQGEVSAETRRGIVAIEQGQVAKTANIYNLGKWVAGGWTVQAVADSAFAAAGDRISVNGLSQSNSVNSSFNSEAGSGEGEGVGGDATASSGGSGTDENGIPLGSGDRQNIINIKSNQNYSYKPVSSAFSTDNGVSQEGPNDGDNNLNDADTTSKDISIVK